MFLLNKRPFVSTSSASLQPRVTWCIQLYRSTPAFSPDGGWCTSHMGVWAAVQRPRKADLDGRGLKLGRRIRGGRWGFPERNFNYTPTPFLAGCTLEDAFGEVRRRLLVIRNVGNVRGGGVDPFLLLLSFASP